MSKVSELAREQVEALAETLVKSGLDAQDAYEEALRRICGVAPELG